MIQPDELLTMLKQPFDRTDLLLPGKSSGKVRDSYSLPGKKRLLVTTDRLSAFDRVLHCVPFKGQVLNQLSAWWFEQTQPVIPNHILSIPDANAAVVTEVDPFTVEVIVRGYITGVTKTALWYRYSLGERQIYGYTFPEGLVKNQALPTPIMGAEDFSYVLQKVPGAMMFLGATPEGGDFRSCCALHSNRMVIDERVMARGIAMHCAIAEAYLNDGFTPQV